MSSNLIAILLALLAYFGWATADTISIRLFRRNNPSIITVVGGIYRLALWLVLLPLFINQIKQITLRPLVFNLLAGFSSGLGLYFFGKATKTANSSLVTAISGGWGVSALILSVIFLKEKITLLQWLAIILTFVGLYFATFSPNWFKNKKIFSQKGLIYALFAFLLWGFCGAFLKIPARSYGWYWTSVIMLIPYMLVILTETKRIKLKDLFHIVDYKYLLLMVLFIALADMGYNGSFSVGGSAAITGTIGGSYATGSTLLTYLVYREKITKRQLLGIILSLTGVVLVSYFTSVGI